MRLLFTLVILVAVLVQAPVPTFANTNQEAAEKIANFIGERFPDAEIDILYRGGQVWLKGESSSQEQRQQIVDRISKIPGVNVTEVKDEIQVVIPKTPARVANSPVVVAPVPLPSTAVPKTAAPVAQTATGTQLTQPQQAQSQQAQPQPAQQAQPVQPPQVSVGAALAPYPQQHYAPAYGSKPGQPSAVPPPYAPNPYAMPTQAMPQQPIPQQAQQQYARQHQPAYYGPPPQAAYHPEAYGPQGPLPGQYNQPNLPDYAWPTYANYPNYSQVTYPRSYSPKAWPYIGPFYPYPQVPLGWRKVTLEHHNGWWWLDFDDGAPSGAFNGLFRQPRQYTY